MTTNPTVATSQTPSVSRLETAALVALLLFVASVQWSIAISQILLTVVVILWLVILLVKQESLDLPPICLPLLAYVLLTMVSVATSIVNGTPRFKGNN